MYTVSPPILYKKLYKRVIWEIPETDDAIYLTFDDGPIPEVTPWVLEQLKKYEARATFFCIGKNVQENKRIFDRIMAEGHEVGNHTFDHPDAWKTSFEDYQKSVVKCENIFTSKLFRPPYGKLPLRFLKEIREKYSVVMWSVLSGDYDKNTSPEKCLKNVLGNTKPGSIIVFHDSLKAQKNMSYCLPRVLEHFSEKGWKFKPIKPFQ